MARRKDPFSNHIDQVNSWDATNELTPMSMVDAFKAATSWDLPPAYVCIVRAQHTDGTVTERSYRNAKSAHNYMLECLRKDSEFTLLTEEALRDTVTHDPMPYDNDDED